MSEFWKSTAKYFCKFCDVYIADNKSSIQLHEGGNKHKNKVKERIRLARTKGADKEKDERELKKQLEAINKAALEAFKDDIRGNDNLKGDSSLRHHFVQQIRAEKQDPTTVEPQLKPNLKIKRENNSIGGKHDKDNSLDSTPVTEEEKFKSSVKPLALDAVKFDDNTGMSNWVSVESNSGEEGNSGGEQTGPFSPTQTQGGIDDDKVETKKEDESIGINLPPPLTKGKVGNERKGSAIPQDKVTKENNGNTGLQVESDSSDEERNLFRGKRMKKLQQEEEYAKKVFVEKVTPSIISKTETGAARIGFKKKGKGRLKQRIARSRDD